MAAVKNPVLKGFHPDPSMICVGEDFYIATSTFEWYPGIQIYHSRNLAGWELAARPLADEKKINLMGCPDSGGVWAPCLSWWEGTFYLVYSNVRAFRGRYFDVHNYVITAKSITGPWSAPLYLNSSGFDPSLFHDEDGRKWMVNMQSEYRAWKNRSAGITLQEYSEQAGGLIGKPKLIFAGTRSGAAEGPHIYKKDGFYYLMCAEGGTGYRHCVTVLRSREVAGPYELSPYTPMLTSLQYPKNPLQKAGHGSLAMSEDGNWYMAHLCARPVGEHKRCILGRETAIQNVIWEDGWPRLASRSNEPEECFQGIGDTGADGCFKRKWKDDFNEGFWNENFQSLRVPLKERASLSKRPGYLRMYGKESLESCYEQSLLACRQQDFYMRVETKLDFSPVSCQQTAGLVYYYDTSTFYYLYVSKDEDKGRVLGIMVKDREQFTQPLGVGIAVPEQGEIWMRLTTRRETASFTYSLDGENYIDIGLKLDATILSDDYYGMGRFTGAFAGICCQDLTGSGTYGDFDYFSYEEL